MGTRPILTRRDMLQVRAFETLFKHRVDEQGIDMAFASAITDTSDDTFGEAVLKRPELVEQWFNSHKGKIGNGNGFTR